MDWHGRNFRLPHAQHILPNRNNLFREGQQLQKLVPTLNLIVDSTIDWTEHILEGWLIGSQFSCPLPHQSLSQATKYTFIGFLNKTDC